MSLPLIPFIAGAAAGGLIVYWGRDDKVRGKVSKGIDTLKNKISPKKEAEATEVQEGAGKDSA